MYYGQNLGVVERGPSPLVTGTPSQTARLRPLRNPLYDTAKFNAAVAIRQGEFFVNRRNFADGTAKDERYTNMTSDGQLGVPLEFDLLGLTGQLQMGTTLLNINTFYNSGVLKWYFHQNVPWLQLRLNLFPSGISPAGFTTEPTSTIFANGTQSLNNFFNMTDHNRKARHILPQENFRGVIEFPTAFTADTEDVYYMVQMLGLLYAAL